MQRHWTDHELETYWSFSSDEVTLLPQRDASSRLGVAASLKFFQLNWLQVFRRADASRIGEGGR